MKQLILSGALALALGITNSANAQESFRVFFDPSGSAGSDAAPHPGSATLSYGNPVLPVGGGRLYIYGEFQSDDQTVLSPNFDITIDGGTITGAWNYNGAGQDIVTGDNRWDVAAPNPLINPGGSSVSFTSANLTHMGLKNGAFADLFDAQHDNTRDFGDTLLGYIDVEAAGAASVWLTVGVQGFALLGGSPESPILFGYDDASVAAGDAGVRTQIADATVLDCDPCDMNCDGPSNAFDIEPFLDILFAGAPPCSDCTGDTNDNDVVDAFDIEPFLSCLFGDGSPPPVSAQDSFRVFLDPSGNAGSDAAPHPGSATLSYGNPVLPVGGGRLYIYAEFQSDDQTVLSPNFDITIDGGTITGAWNYNGAGQDDLTLDNRWDIAAPNPLINPGGSSVSFTSANLIHMGLKNSAFADLFDVQHDDTRGFGDTLLGYIDVEAAGAASVWLTVGQQGFALLGGDPDSPILFGYDDASVAAGDAGARTQIADATVDCDPSDPPVCVVAPSEMVSWWPGDGNADDIQDGNNGTLVNGAAFASGKVGQAFSLDGANDFIEIADSADLNPAQITLDAWVRPNTINEGGRVISKEISTTTCVDPFVVYSLEVRGRDDHGGPANSAAFFFTTADNILHVVRGTSAFATGIFTHIAGTYDGSIAKIYVNGALENSLTVSGTLQTSSAPVVIGNGGAGCRALFSGFLEFDGLIDEVEIFDRALSATEIQGIFNAGIAGKCKPGFCSSDAQCPPDSKCFDSFCNLTSNTCQLGDRLPGCCASDDQCGKCETCDLVTNTCNNDVPGCCASDAQCGKCETCDLVTNTCNNDVPGCCASDLQCGECEACDLATNTCFDRAGCCSSDDECPPDSKCFDSFCDLTTNTCQLGDRFPGCCTDDSECGECETCDLATNTCFIGICPPQERIDVSTKGSALIYSKVDLRWGPDGRVLQDTILEITNDYPDDVYVQFYFVNGDEPRDPIFALDPPVMVSEGEPGWNWVDCQTLLTSNQPKYWSASSGSPLGCQPFTILDPDGGNGPGRLDPESQDGGRVLRGYVLAWAVDAQGHPIRWNHLSGAATIVNYGAQAAWEYNAWAAQHGTSSTNNNQVGGPGHLSFDGIAYDLGFDVLLMDFYASGSTALSGGGFMASSDTDLTLHPLSADLRQETRGPVTTKAHFDIWNGNEQRFSGTHRCITCWDQTLLSRYDAPNHFLLAFLGTDKGKARIDGQRSDVCDVDCIPAAEDLNGTDWGVCSYDASLIGVVARILEFSGPVTGRRAMSGRSLVGAGTQNAEILYDIIAPPGELRDDAYEALGGIQSDAPVRIGSLKQPSSRATDR